MVQHSFLQAFSTLKGHYCQDCLQLVNRANLRVKVQLNLIQTIVQIFQQESTDCSGSNEKTSFRNAALFHKLFGSVVLLFMSLLIHYSRR